LRRDGARGGDALWVSGTLGDARRARHALRGDLALPPRVLALTRQRLERPTPRVALGLALRGIASSGIDLSDGLAGDLGHILKASAVGACIEAEVASELIAALACLDWPMDRFTPHDRLRHVLAGGDDYELAFTAPPSARTAVQAAAARAATPVARIGGIQAERGLWLCDAQGTRQPVRAVSFDHFA
jgi:thiamine-monophosphate kinase